MSTEPWSCRFCGKPAEMEVTWPDGYVLYLCDKDMPVPEPDMSFKATAQMARDMIEDVIRYVDDS